MGGGAEAGALPDTLLEAQNHTHRFGDADWGGEVVWWERDKGKREEL